VWTSLRSRRREWAIGAAIAIVAIAAASLAMPALTGSAAASPAADATPGADPTGLSSISLATATAGLPSPSDTGTPTPLPTPTATPFPLIDMFAPMPPESPAPANHHVPSEKPGPPLVDPGRDIPDQSFLWLVAKASGRVVLSNGKIDLLAAGTYPLANPLTGAALPDARTLDVGWTRWIIEPTGTGKDAKNNSYTDLTYWNLCGPGAATVALYYWQQLTGHPDVTGMAGYFLEPYKASGVGWPSPGPVFVGTNGKQQHVGTYWNGRMRAPGYWANSRGFVMYMAMAVLPAGWTSPGIDVFVGGDGKPLYPTRGSPPNDMQAALNWEASGHAADWAETWYANVPKWDPTMARDLQAAVMLDVGRDGVPVIVQADTYYLPNWKNGSRTPHTRHSVTIVGYDNEARTFTYLDTCGRSCNSRGGNANGQVHVISQAQMVQAVSQDWGMGFVW
jgi:hypothetical protein